MVLAATHMLVPIIFFESMRDRSRRMARLFSPKHTFLVGVAGLMPDMDEPLSMVLNAMGMAAQLPADHRIFLHNVWIPLGFLLFAAFFTYAWPSLAGRKDRRYRQGRSLAFAKVFLLLAASWMFHLALDAVFTGGVMPFYPLDSYLLDWNLVGMASAATGVPGLDLLVSMDALLLLFWLWHEEFTHRIRDYF